MKYEVQFSNIKTADVALIYKSNNSVSSTYLLAYVKLLNENSVNIIPKWMQSNVNL